MNEKHLKFSPITIFIFPHHSKNIILKMMKNTFSSSSLAVIMKSGPKGRGYKFRVMKDRVKRVTPVFVMTLKICAFAAAAYGVPLPFSALPGAWRQHGGRARRQDGGGDRGHRAGKG